MCSLVWGKSVLSKNKDFFLIMHIYMNFMSQFHLCIKKSLTFFKDPENTDKGTHNTACFFLYLPSQNLIDIWKKCEIFKQTSKHTSNIFINIEFFYCFYCCFICYAMRRYMYKCVLSMEELTLLIFETTSEHYCGII